MRIDAVGKGARNLFVRVIRGAYQGAARDLREAYGMGFSA